MSSKLEVWKCYSYAINPSLQNKWGVGREIFFKRREHIKEISSPLSTYFFAPLLTVGLAWFFPQLIFSPHLFLLSLVILICFSHFSLLLQNHRPKLFLFINRKQWLIPLECYPVILQLLVPPILPYWSYGTKMVEVTLFTGEKFWKNFISVYLYC